ncbi:MAG: glycosyltransferase family 4 protein [Verrucomicrobiota bacterium]
MLRIAIIVSHPIQHFVHFYRALARQDGIVLRVFYASSIGAKSYFDKDMGVPIQWKTDLLSGYDHVFLPEADSITSSGFWKVNNPSVTAALDEFKPGVVKIHGYAQMTLLRALFWCRRNHVKTLLWSDSELLHDRSKTRRATKQFVLRALFSNINGFLTVGDNNEAYFRNYGVPAERMFRVSFTIDEAGFARAREDKTHIRETWRSRLGLSPETFVVLCVGKLIVRKRPGDLIEAIKIICFKQGGNKDVAVMFAGDGPLRQMLEKATEAVKGKCRFLGFVNVNKLPEVYVTADALAQVSDIDAHPLTTSEAAFVGLPLIVSDKIGAVGATDTARPNVNALVYPCGDALKLANAIQRLAEDANLRLEMGTASLRVAEELNMHASVRHFLLAAGKVLESNPSR